MKHVFFLVFALLTMIALASPTFTSPTPFFSSDISGMEAGAVTVAKANTTDQESGSEFKGSCTITFSKMSGSTVLANLKGLIGYQSMNIVLPDEQITYTIKIEHIDLTSFRIIFKSTLQDFFYQVEVRYLFCDISIFPDKSYVLQQISTNIGMNQIQTKTSTSLNPKIKYKALITFTEFKVIKAGNITCYIQIKVSQIKLVNSQYQYTISVASTISIPQISANVLFYNQKIAYPYQLYKHRLKYHQFQLVFNNSKSNFLSQADDFKLSSENTFIGMSGNSGFQVFDFDTNFASSNSKIGLTFGNQGIFAKIQILAFYEMECNSPFFYSELQGICKFCSVQNCADCQSQQLCNQCQDGFQLSAGKDLCECNYQAVSGICYDFDNDQRLRGCSHAYNDSATGQIQCRSCRTDLNLVFTSKLANEICVCIEGFQRTSWNQPCIQKCGDKIIVGSEQCDDGNLLDGDGCASDCTLQLSSGMFDCDTTVNPTFCSSSQQISFKVTSMMKNQNNSALYTISPTHKSLIFPFDSTQFSQDSIQLTVFSRSGSPEQIELETYLMKVQANEITILVNFNFTIESLTSKMTVDMSQTRYLSYDQVSWQFESIGSNKALKFSNYLSLFESTQVSVLVFSILAILLLFIGLLTPKFIAFEAVLTMMFIFYLQLMIVKPENFPVGFNYLKYLKLSTGYNEVLELTNYSIFSTVSRKMLHLTLRKTAIQNFNVSSVLLFTAVILLALTGVIRKLKQISLINVNDHTPDQAVSKKEIQTGLKTWNRFNELTYQALSQISFWAIPQIFCCVYTQVALENSYVWILDDSQDSIFLDLNAPVLVFSFTAVLLCGINTFANTLLSAQSNAKLEQRPCQYRYRQTLFVYICLMAFFIFTCNQVVFFGIVPFSLIVLLLQVGYMAVLFHIKPYQLSLHIHSWALFANHMLLLVFLVFINLINFFDGIDDFFVMVMGFIIAFGFLVIIALTCVRLYFEYRYGEILEKQIQAERQKQEKLRIQEEELQLKMKMEFYEIEAKNKVSMEVQQRRKNRFLYQNQILEDRMNDLLYELEKKQHWTAQKKEEYYFSIFDSKPMSWLKQHNKPEYQRKLKEQEIQIQKDRQKQEQLQKDPERQQLKKKLKKQLNHKKKLYYMHHNRPFLNKNWQQEELDLEQSEADPR